MIKIIEKDLTKDSTIRTPAFTKYFTYINNDKDIVEAIDFVKENNLRFKVLGNGSNILFSKKYYDDILFIKLSDGFKSIIMHDEYVEIGGSYSLIQAGRSLVGQGYEDYIFFNLIPATIGGAIRQNAGTGDGEEIEDVCSYCRVFDIVDMKIVELSNMEMQFKYRHSIVKSYPERYIVLSAKFKLENKTNKIDKLILEMKNRVKEKTAREPKGYCFGSTFMNNKMSAWQYIDSIIEQLPSMEGAFFSRKHKNWIINNDADGIVVEKLIRQAQLLIKDKFNIDLKEEVDII